MKKRNRYRNYVSMEAAVVVLVLLCFRFIPDKKMASLVTSTLFIGSTLAVLFWERKFDGFQKRASFWGAITFLIVSALPIFILRIAFWDLNFDDIQVMGLSGRKMHEWSQYVFLMMLVTFFIDSYLEQQKERKNL